MTIQSLAWAIEQPPEGVAKLVLIALANHADHTTGFVHFDASTIAREASIQVSGLWGYLGALERNGYLAKDQRKDKAEKRDYWLVFDRENSAPWSWAAQDGEVEPSPSPLPPEMASAAPKAFVPEKQAEAREASAPKTDVVQFPVIDGSDAARAWIAHDRAHGRVSPFVHWVTLKDGKNVRGFYKPTLFPPRDIDRNFEDVA